MLSRRRSHVTKTRQTRCLVWLNLPRCHPDVTKEPAQILECCGRTMSVNLDHPDGGLPGQKALNAHFVFLIATNGLHVCAPSPLPEKLLGQRRSQRGANGIRPTKAQNYRSRTSRSRCDIIPRR